MATRRSQRIGVWVIAGVMFLGTIGGFVAMMVAPSNQAKDDALLKAEEEDYNKLVQARQQKVDAQSLDLSGKYFDNFSQFASRVGEFKASDVEELTTEDLVVGDGEEINDSTEFATYYIGWNPSGKIFDQSIEGETLRAPFDIPGLANAGVIEGWQKGLIGMKIGGVRLLAIPSDLAYGEAGGGDDIPSDTPIKFVIMAIPRPEEIPYPEVPPLLLKEYQKNGYY